MNDYCCEGAEKALANIPADTTVTNLSEFFKMFGDYSRIRLLFALKQGDLCVQDLSSILKMTQPAVSHQIKMLRLHKIVGARREGKKIFYKLIDNHILEILETGLVHLGHE